MHKGIEYMFQAIRTYIVGVVLAASFLLFGVLSAFADSYSVNVVANTQSESFYGIDAAGDFVVDMSGSLAAPNSSCGGVSGASQCFATYYADGTSPVYSTIAPTLTWDNGTACTHGTLSGICNNGHELLGGYLGNVKGIWTGPGLKNYLMGGSFDGGFINAFGDAVFINGANDTLVSVVDTSSLVTPHRNELFVDPKPVPEPASLWLMGMGMMVAAGMVRQRAYCRVGVRKSRLK